MTETPEVDPRSAVADEDADAERTDVEGATTRHAADGPADGRAEDETGGDAPLSCG